MPPNKPQPQDCPLGLDIISQYLPHRAPIQLVDRVMSFNDTRITAHTDLSRHEGLFSGHFPDRAILPGIYMIEMAAQSGALLISLTSGLPAGKFIGFSGVDNVKFRTAVRPDDILNIDVELTRIRLPFYKFKGKVSVSGKTAITLEFSAALMDFTG